MLAAAVEGWDYPWPRAEALLADLYDATRWAAGDKKWKGYPRPFPLRGATSTQRFGNTNGRSDAEVRDYLRSLGHHLPPV